MSTPSLTRITPVLFVERIEPSAAFWQQRLGFARTIEVPGEHGLGFAAFSDGTLEVMYQTYASGAEDVAALAAAQRQGPTFLFVQVADIDVPIECAGVRIEPGDLVFGDVDGIVVVPRHVEDEVLSRAFHKVASENRTRDDLLQGAKLGEVFDRYGVL